MSLASYGPTWPDVHMTPEELVRAHVALRGDALVPVHWATFNLAFHDWNEPVYRAAAAAREQGVRLLVPRPGERLEPAAAKTTSTDWWKERWRSRRALRPARRSTRSGRTRTRPRRDPR